MDVGDPIGRALGGAKVGLAVAVATYVGLRIADATGVIDVLSAIDNANAANDSPGVVAGVVGGLAGATKWAKDLFDKTVGFPASSVKDMYDIASEDSPEAQADKAWDVYFDMTGIKNAPEGSVGGDIKEAHGKMQEFYKGESDIP